MALAFVVAVASAASASEARGLSSSHWRTDLPSELRSHSTRSLGAMVGTRSLGAMVGAGCATSPASKVGVPLLLLI